MATKDRVGAGSRCEARAYVRCARPAVTAKQADASLGIASSCDDAMVGDRVSSDYTHASRGVLPKILRQSWPRQAAPWGN